MIGAPQRGLIAITFLKAVHGHVYEHVHVNDHGSRYVDVDVYVLVLVDGFFKISKTE